MLAKEFVVDPRQLDLLRAAGADAVLLLAVLHPRRALARLVEQALEIGLEPLVEAHDERELEPRSPRGARVIGLNNRDLRTLAVDPDRASRLRELVPDDRLVIAESGVRDAGDRCRAWRALGFDAALVGEALVRAGRPGGRRRAFVAAGSPPARSRRTRPGAVREDLRDHRRGGRPRRGPAGRRRDRAEPGAGHAAALSLDEAVALARLARASAAPRRARSSRSRRTPATEQIAEIVAAHRPRRDPDVNQRRAAEPVAIARSSIGPAWKVLHLPRRPSAGRTAPAAAGRLVDARRREPSSPPARRGSSSTPPAARIRAARAVAPTPRSPPRSPARCRSSLPAA